MFITKWFRFLAPWVIPGLVLLLTSCGIVRQTEEPIGMPNPASVYCEEQGGQLEIRTGAAGEQAGVCIFDDGSECDEWAFYRGECQPVPAATEEQASQDASPASPPAYTNPDFGFTFNPPDGWVIEDHGDYLLFTRLGYRFFVGFQAAGEDPKPFRTGMPEGEFVDGGSSLLLGQPISKQNLVFQSKIKVVSYGGRIQAGNLILVMYLDALETPEVGYADLDIPPEVIAEADQIIASFAFTSGEIPVLEFTQ